MARNPHGLQIRMEQWGPRKAKAHLAVNPERQRPLSVACARKFAEIIERGEWDPANGVTIKIGEDQSVIDGKTRLNGVIISGKTVNALTVRGVPVKSFNSIDTTSRSRSNADVLAINGHGKNRMIRASIIRYIHRRSNGRSMWHTGGVLGTPTPTQAMEIMEREQARIEESSHFAASNGLRKVVPASVVAFSYYECGKVHKKDRDEFFVGLRDGSDLKAGSPILTLRNRFAAMKATPQQQYPASVYLYMIYRAWNAWRSGETRIRVMVPKKMEGPFPKPK